MKKNAFLGVGALALLAMPIAAPAVVLEGHFSGRADHNSGGPGTYVVSEAYTTYQTLNTTQQNPWYPWNATVEYTVVVTTSVTAYDGVSNPQTVSFADAQVDIYEDASNNADFANPATFTDGTLVLSGTISNYSGFRINFFGNPWTVNGSISFTGGSGLGNVDPQCGGGNMVMNDFINFEIPFGGWPDAQGYEEGYDSKWECPDVVGTDESTWGKVKSLYR